MTECLAALLSSFHCASHIVSSKWRLTDCWLINELSDAVAIYIQRGDAVMMRANEDDS